MYGYAIARSKEAKALGIRLGDAWHLLRDEFDRWGVQVRSSNYTLYGYLPARVIRVLGYFTPDLKMYSLDEEFLGLSPSKGARPRFVDCSDLSIKSIISIKFI